jgi:transcriptional regulator with XRE-family HTH domain
LKKQLGERLRKLRTNRSMDQVDVAILLGIGRYSISKYETGETSPTLENLSKLADIFGVTTDYLLGRENEETAFLRSENIKLSEQVQHLKDSIQSLTKGW